MDISDVPIEARDQVAGTFHRIDHAIVQSLESHLRARAQAGESIQRTPSDLTCVIDTRTLGTVDEVVDAVKRMQAGSVGTGRSPSGSDIILDLPFEWTFVQGDVTTTGVSPAVMIASVSNDGVSTALTVRYTVTLGNVPQEGRQQVKDSVMAVASEAGPMWQEAIATLIASQR